jgi:hypothetical protein
MKDRERPAVPEIEGLLKGQEFLQRRTIEGDRELWAARRRAVFPDRKADLLVISLENEHYFDLPALGLRDDKRDAEANLMVPLWVPRVHPITGAIYITRWLIPQQLDNETFIAFGGKKFREGIDLTTLPASWEVAWLIPQKVPAGIESAMRQQDVIRYDTDADSGIEQKRIESALLTIHAMTDIFVESHVSDETLEAMAKGTERALKAEGLLTAKDSIWKKIVDYTQRAARKDGLNRTNPPASRVLARAGYLKVVERELILREIKTKAARIYRHLELNRSLTRQRMGDAADTLDSLGGFGNFDGDILLREGSRTMVPREAWRIGRVVRAVSEKLLEPVQAAPYLAWAVAAQVALMGTFFKSKRQIERARLVLKSAGLERELSRESVEGYLRGRDRVAARQRMRHAYTFIRMVLNDPDNQETRVFE